MQNYLALLGSKKSKLGKLPSCDNNEINAKSFKQVQLLINDTIDGGFLTTTPIVSTYSLAYTVANSYMGGILAPNGDVHFIPCYSTRGQKISPSGVVSTYSLAYTGGV